MSINLKDLEALCTALLGSHPEKIQHTTSRIHQQLQQSLSKPRKKQIQLGQVYEKLVELEEDLEIKKRIIYPRDLEQISKPDFLISKTVKGNLRGTVLLQIKRNLGKPYFTFNKKESDHLNHILKFWSSTYFLLIDETMNPFFIFFVRSIEIKNLIPNQRNEFTHVKNDDLRRHSRGTNLFSKLFLNCQIGQIMTLHKLSDMIHSWSIEHNRILIELFFNRIGVSGNFFQSTLFGVANH